MAHMEPYIVQQGDYLDKIAFEHGCTPEDIWGHKKNSTLRQIRSDGSILNPGDLLWVPASEPQEFDLKAGELNIYEIDVSETQLKLFLVSEGKRLADEPYVVIELPSDKEQKSGPDGSVLLEVPVTLESITIALPKRGYSFSVRLGHLDPIGEFSGIIRRLENLGYLFEGSLASESEVSEAIGAFQLAAGLPVTGELSAATRDALVKAHGS